PRHLRILQQSGLQLVRLELVAEVDDAGGAVHDGHPHLRAHLARGRHLLRVVDVRSLDAAPDRLLAAGPFRQALHAAGDVPELSGDLRVVVYDGADVEAGDGARFEVGRVVLRVVASHVAADVIVDG